MKKLVLLLAILIVFIPSCIQMEELEAPVTEQEATDENDLRTRSGMGSANNPYSLANVQSAYDQLVDELGLEPMQFEPSHHYVRFLPSDTTHIGILSDSLFLELFQYPLDRILTDEEINFYENDLINGYPWQYTIVPYDNFTFPDGIEYEILDEVYIQNDQISSQSTQTAALSIPGLDPPPVPIKPGDPIKPRDPIDPEGPQPFDPINPGGPIIPKPNP